MSKKYIRRYKVGGSGSVEGRIISPKECNSLINIRMGHYVCSPRHGARGKHAMASEEHKMAFAEHARKGGAGLRFFLRSTETYRPRRKNIMNSIFRQNVFAKNNVLRITYISPRLPQRFVLFCFFLCFSTARVPRDPLWNSNSKQISFLEFKFHCRNMSCVSGTHVAVNAINCHFLECRATRAGTSHSRTLPSPDTSAQRRRFGLDGT